MDLGDEANGYARDDAKILRVESGSGASKKGGNEGRNKFGAENYQFSLEYLDVQGRHPGRDALQGGSAQPWC